MTDYNNKIIGKGGGGGGDVDPDTLFTNSIGKGIYIFSEGPTGGLSTGDAKSIYLNDVPLRDSQGNASAKGVAWTWRDGLPDQKYIDGFPAAVSFQNVNVNVKQGSPHAVTIANGSDNYDAAYVVVSIPTLVFRSKKGNMRKAQVSYQIQVRANGGSWVTQHSVRLDEKASSQWEGTYRVSLPAGGSPWQVRLVRTSPNSDEQQKPDGSMTQSETYFARYATITDGKFTYRNTAVLGLQFNAEDYGDSIPSVKALMKGIKCYVPTNYNPTTRTYATSGAGTSGGLWDGSFKAAVTDNPIWIYHDLLINNRYGLGQDFNPTDDPETAFVDKWSLYTIAQYCDQQVSNGRGGLEPRFTINCQITNKQEAYDLLQNIIASVNGMLYFSAEKVVAVSDRPQTVVDAFTQADVENGLFEYSGTALKTRHSVCIVNFKDPDNLYKTSNVIYEDPEYMAEIGYRVTEVDAFGCTSRAQALRLAKWTLRTERSQTQTVTFQTGHRGGLLRPGDIIKVFDDYKTGLRAGGKVLSSEHSGSNTNFTLDAPMNVSTSDKLIYISASGQLREYPIRVSSNSNVVSVAGNVELPIDGATFAIVFASLDGQQFRVLVVEDEGDGTYTVSALQHDPNKFAYVDEGIILDDIPTTIISSEAPSPVTQVTVQEFAEEVSGTRSNPKVTISWERAKYSPTYPVVSKRNELDERITRYELQFKTPDNSYQTVYSGNSTTWTSPLLEPILPPTVDMGNGVIIDPDNPFDQRYGARVRSVDQLGRVSSWYVVEDFYVGADGAPPPVTNEAANPVLGGVIVTWDNPVTPAFKHVEIKMISVPPIDEETPGELPEGDDLLELLFNTPVSARIVDDFYIVQNLENDDPVYFFLRVATHNNDKFSAYRVVSGVRGKLSAEDFPADYGGISIVDELPPVEGWTGSEIIFLRTDGKLYHVVNGQWVPVIADVGGGITPVETLPETGTEGQYVTIGGVLYVWTNGEWVRAVPDVDPIPTVSSLPTNAQEGDVVFLSTDGKLYRYHNGAWTSSVAAGDITGSITSAQIASIVASKITGTLAAINIPGIDASKIVSGELDSTRIGSIVASKITGTLAAAQIPGIDASKIISGKLSNTYIDSIVASKITGILDEAQIPDIDVSKLVGEITSSQIQSVVASKITGTLAAAQIPGLDASKIVSGTISNTYIESIVASKVTGTLAAAQIPGIDAGKIVSGQFGSARILDEAITTAKITEGAIVSSLIASEAIVAGKIAAGAVVAGTIAAGAVTADELAANSVIATKIATGAVVAGKIAAGAVSTDELAANSVISTKIAANAVVAGKIAANAVAADQIAANAVVAGKIATGAVVAGTIAAGAVNTDELAANSVIAAKIATGAIVAGKIAADAVTSNTIAANAVTATHILAGSINADHIQGNTITGNKIVARTLVAEHLVGGTITAFELAANSVTATKIAANSIKADHIQAGAITAATLGVTELSALTANLGSITAGSINIANKFIVSSSGNVTISSGSTGPRLVLTNTQLQVYDAARIRVRIGLA